MRDILRDHGIGKGLSITQKTDLVTVVGSPAVVTDDITTIITKIQSAKTTLAANITAQGINTAVGSESLSALAGKVSSGVKQWANGRANTGTTFDGATGAYGGYWATVTGLTFTPLFVYVYLDNDDYALYSTSSLMTTARNRVRTANSYFNSAISINANGFSVKFALSNYPFDWIAIG